MNVDLKNNPLLQRAFIFLEDGDYSNADLYLEKVLDENPTNGEAYLGKLLIDLKLTNPEQLDDCGVIFGENANYQKVIKYGEAELVNEIRQSLNNICEAAYQNAIDKEKSAVTVKDWEQAIAAFVAVKQYKEVKTHIERCSEELEKTKKNNLYNNITQRAAAIEQMGETALAIKRYEAVIGELEKLEGWRDTSELIEVYKGKIQEISDLLLAKSEEDKKQKEIKTAERKKKIKKAVKTATKIMIALVVVFIIGFVAVKFVVPKIQLASLEKAIVEENYEKSCKIIEKIKNKEKAYSVVVAAKNSDVKEKMLKRFVVVPQTEIRDGDETTTEYWTEERRLYEKGKGGKKTYTEYDEDGNVVTMFYTQFGVNSEDTLVKIKYSYDDGKLEKEEHTNTENDKVIKTIRYKYDLRGNCIEERMEGDFVITSEPLKVLQRFDENNNCISRKEFGEYNELEAEITFEYDEDGNVIEEIHSDKGENDYIKKKIYDYDSDGNCTYTKTIYTDGDETERYKKYNKHGKIIEDEYINSSGGEIITKYQYDENNLLVKMVEDSFEEGKTVTEYKDYLIFFM